MVALKHNHRPAATGVAEVDRSNAALHDLGVRLARCLAAPPAQRADNENGEAPEAAAFGLIAAFIRHAETHIEVERRRLFPHCSRPYLSRHMQMAGVLRRLERMAGASHRPDVLGAQALDLIDEFFVEAFCNGPYRSPGPAATSQSAVAQRP